MVQISEGATHNDWISFMKACASKYKKQKAEAKLKASAESVNSQRGKSKRSKREVKEHAEPQNSKEAEEPTQRDFGISRNHGIAQEA